MDVKLQSAKVLSAQEEKKLNESIQAMKDVRDGKEITQGVKWESDDTRDLEAKIKVLEDIKKTHGLPELSAKERARAQDELRLLEADLQRDMPTWREFNMTPKDGAKYTALVRQIVAWERDPMRRQKVQRWRTLRRLMDPSDPLAGSTMFLHPQ